MALNLEKLFARYASGGNPRDLAEVFDRTAPELLRLALHLVRRENEAEDLLQATFLTAMQKARRFNPQKELLPWLCGILANHAMNSENQCSLRVPHSGPGTGKMPGLLERLFG